jgi:hypothetical protein
MVQPIFALGDEGSYLDYAMSVIAGRARRPYAGASAAGGAAGAVPEPSGELGGRSGPKISATSS